MNKASSPSLSHSQDGEKDLDDIHEFDLHEYDLDVVDSVLNNPHQTEYYDHFGFKIEVKTDDEDSDDSSEEEDDEERDEENKVIKTHKEGTFPSSTNSSSNTSEGYTSTRRYSNGSSHNIKSVFSSSASGSDEDEYSVDTALTTPTTHKHQRLSTSSLEQPHSLNSIPTRLDTNPEELANLDRSHLQYNTDHVISPPPRTSNSSHSSSFAGATTFIQYSTPMMARGKPTTTSTAQRPSQAFRERQNKRMSELSYIMSPVRTVCDITSPPLTRTSTTSKRLSVSSTVTTNTSINTTTGNSYYGMLKAKFKRTSQETEETERESMQHIKLRQDALNILEKERKAHPGEYDWEFWKSMILDVEKVATTQGIALKHHMSIGIPEKLRGSLWQLLAKSKNRAIELEAVYVELLKRTSPHEKLIQHDLETSFPMSKFFPSSIDTNNNDDEDSRKGRSQQCTPLFNILKAYSLFDQEVGYSQALTFVVAVLLTQIPDEASVFCLLVQLMGPYGLQGHHVEPVDTLQLHLYQFDHLLQLTLPELHRHVDALGIKPDMYVSRWFATCFSYHCSPSLVVRVIDLILVEGAYVLQRFILALLKRNQNIIMDLGFEALMRFFQLDIFEAYKGRRNEFVIDMYQIEISPKLYARLVKQYNSEIARRTKQRTEDDEMRSANERLTSHVQALQDKYRVLEMEHQEMTKQAVETKMAMAKMDADNEELTHKLKQLRAHFEATERQRDAEHQARLEDVYKSNAQLIKNNAALQDQISDMEAVLISLKMNYAERESEYQILRRQLLEAQKS